VKRLGHFLVLSDKAEQISVEVRMLDDEAIGAGTFENDSAIRVQQDQFVALCCEFEFLSVK